MFLVLKDLNGYWFDDGSIENVILFGLFFGVVWYIWKNCFVLFIILGYIIISGSINIIFVLGK